MPLWSCPIRFPPKNIDFDFIDSYLSKLHYFFHNLKHCVKKKDGGTVHIVKLGFLVPEISREMGLGQFELGFSSIFALFDDF